MGKKFVTLIFVSLIGVNTLFSQTETTETGDKTKEKKQEYRTFAIGISTLDALFGVIGITGEFAVLKNLGIQLDFAYVSLSLPRGGTYSGGQIGGGLRYYFDGKGLMGGWLGGYLDYMDVNFDIYDGLDGALLIGYKLVGGPFFVDGFAGIRFISYLNQTGSDALKLGPRLGLNIGLCF